MRFAAPLPVLLATACASSEVDVGTQAGSSAGYVDVTWHLSGVPDGITTAQLGDVAAFDLQRDDRGSLTTTIQGSATTGVAALTLDTADGPLVIDNAYTYQAPRDPRFDTVVAFGASLTQGVQGGVPTHHGALFSPPMQIARQLGAYMPLPLLVEDLFPVIGPGDIGPPPTCAVPDVVSFVSSAAAEVIPKLLDPETTEFGFQFARVDADIAIHNVAVGGSNIGSAIDGIADNDFGQQFVAHLVLDPYASLDTPVRYTQLELIEALEPTLVLTTDLFGNDLISPIVLGEEIDPSRVTPIDEFEASLTAILARLSDTGAEVFVANVPRPTLLPATAEKRREAIEEGSATAEEVDADIAEIEEMAVAMNELLQIHADGYANIHVVDLAGEVAAIEETGIELEGTVVTVDKFGGLLSMDGIHFSDTGYALVANLFIERINDVLGTDVPPVDMAKVFADDSSSPDAMRAAGFDPDLCELETME